jgi:aminoglycoside phosphotransferase (APT) family kinase protein
LIHNDYKFDNLVLDPDHLGRIVAVLDWEMATLGDPLADLGLLLVYWGGEGGRLLPAVESVSTHPGFYDRDELVEAYAAASGRNVDTLDFYVVLAYFKLAVIIEGIHARYLKGQTVGTGFEHVGLGVPILADAALEVAGRSTIPGLRG